MCQDLSSMLNQKSQDFIFFRGQFDVLVLDAHRTPDKIDRKIIKPKDR